MAIHWHLYSGCPTCNYSRQSTDEHGAGQTELRTLRRLLYPEGHETMDPNIPFFEVILALSVLDPSEENVQVILTVILRPGQHNQLPPTLTKPILPQSTALHPSDSWEILFRFIQQRCSRRAHHSCS